MKLHELSPAAGSVKDVKRVGRGHGSGNGKTAGKGHKGQNARSGGGVRIGFEGGQMPIARRIPKRGFKNIFGTDYAIVNVADLNQFAEGTVVDAELLKATGLVKKVYAGVKVLGNGELTTKLTVKAAKFSKSAVEKIEKSDLTEFVVTNTIPIPKEKRVEKLKIISIAPLFAETIKRNNEARPIDDLFKILD